MDNDTINSGEELMQEERQLRDSVIMMVDDEPILMSVVQAFLQEAGYQNFIMIEDSRLAMDALNKSVPDVLLLDLMMPHVDGFQILEATRANPATRHLPVIILTSSSSSTTKLKALEMGATDFLSKPFDSSELVLRMRNTLTVKAYHDHIAHYDTLTGLPSRALFKDRLKWAIKHAHRTNKSAGILNIDLDRFKHINDTLGPQIGDELLKQVSTRLSDCIRMDDSISRIDRNEISRSMSRYAGDEFSIVLHDVSKTENAAYVARRLINSMNESFFIGDHEINLSISIGIALFPTDGSEVDELLMNAAAATDHSKNLGRSTYQFYSKELNAEAEARFKFETELRKAVVQNQLEIYYQPKVSIATGRVTGMEALVRWHHAEHGMVYPADFVPLAEEMGLIVPMGKWVLNEVCQQHRQWISEGMEPLRVAINVSPHQFSDKDLCSNLQAAIEDHDMDTNCLILEITESVLMGNVEKSVRTMNEIRRLGASLSIDDFGTGYSSLNYLKLFPVGEIKIDRSFILDLPGSRQDAAIISAIVSLAQGFDLAVVAEGVETSEQSRCVSELGCDIVQGYYYSRPLPPEEFKQFVLKQNF